MEVLVRYSAVHYIVLFDRMKERKKEKYRVQMSFIYPLVHLVSLKLN